MIGRRFLLKHRFRFLAVPLLICVAVVLLRFFFFFLYQLPSNETDDTWQPRFVVMHKRGTPLRDALALVQIESGEERSSVLCRIIAVSGDIIQIDKGKLYVNGRKYPTAPIDISVKYYHSLAPREFWAITYIADINGDLHTVGLIKKEQIVGYSY